MATLNNAGYGILLIIGSQIAFALMDSSVKLIAQHDVALPALLFFRNIISLISYYAAVY